MARGKFKSGRKKRPCKANYNAAHRWAINKVKKLVRHIKKQPNDEVAKPALEKAKKAVI